MGVNRREFVKETVRAAVASAVPMIIPSKVLGAGGAVPPSERIQMGFIGVGSMGSGHVRGFLQQPDVRVIAICDVSEEARNRSRDVVNNAYGNKDCQTYNDFRELLARKDIDAVLIATPDFWHALIGIEAARQGKSMYLEKPIALSITEAKALREAVHRYGVVFQEGCQQRSDQRYRHTCELIWNGRIGRLETVMIASAGSGDTNPMPEPKPQPVPPGFDWDLWLGPAPYVPYTGIPFIRTTTAIWNFIHDYGLGSLGGAWGIHDVDIAQWVSGNDHTTPVETEGEAVFFQDVRNVMHTWTVEHRYANGVKVIHMDLASARKRSDHFKTGSMASVMIGSEGWIYVSRQEMRTHPESLMREVIGPNEKKAVFSNDHRRNFLDAVKKRTVPIAGIESAVHGEMMNQQADIALRLGRKVRWDPVKEEFLGDSQATRMMTRPMRSPWRL